MASCDKTKNYIEMQFELCYNKGPEPFVSVAVTLDTGATDQLNKENTASM
jgi:hypothetical protein